MAFKKFRKMKVYNVSGYNYKDTPTIILKGDWLKQTGFDIGSFGVYYGIEYHQVRGIWCI